MSLCISRSLIAATVSGLLLSGGIVSAFAQTTPATAPPTAGAAAAGGRRMKMADALGLTPTQKTQFMTLMKSSRDQRKAIDAQQLTPDAKKTKLKELEKSTRTQMASVLTPAQIAKLKDLRAAQKSGGAAAPGAPVGGSTAPKP